MTEVRDSGREAVKHWQRLATGATATGKRRKRYTRAKDDAPAYLDGELQRNKAWREIRAVDMGGIYDDETGETRAFNIDEDAALEDDGQEQGARLLASIADEIAEVTMRACRDEGVTREAQGFLSNLAAINARQRALGPAWTPRHEALSLIAFNGGIMPAMIAYFAREFALTEEEAKVVILRGPNLDLTTQAYREAQREAEEVEGEEAKTERRGPRADKYGTYREIEEHTGITKSSAHRRWEAVLDRAQRWADDDPVMAELLAFLRLPIDRETALAELVGQS